MSLTAQINVSTLNRKLIEYYYGIYSKKLYFYTLKHYEVTEDEATDLVYKTIYKMAEVHDRYHFENDQQQKAFVFKTHINFLRNFFRDDKTFENRNSRADLEKQHLTSEPITGNTKSVALVLLEGELNKLQEWERILLLMRGQHMPYSSIVPFVDKPEKQLKVYYSRLKKQLYKKVNDALEQLNHQKNDK